MHLGDVCILFKRQQKAIQDICLSIQEEDTWEIGLPQKLIPNKELSYVVLRYIVKDIWGLIYQAVLLTGLNQRALDVSVGLGGNGEVRQILSKEKNTCTGWEIPEV